MRWLIEKAFIILPAMVVVSFTYWLLYDYDVSPNIDGNTLALSIATLEITIAVIVWWRYKNQQNIREKYQKEEIARTLNNMNTSVIRFYRFKFIDTNGDAANKERNTYEKIPRLLNLNLE